MSLPQISSMITLLVNKTVLCQAKNYSQLRLQKRKVQVVKKRNLILLHALDRVFLYPAPQTQPALKM